MQGLGNVLPFHTRAIKQMAPARRLEARLRIPFLGAAVLGLWAVYGLSELLIWYVLRSAIYFLFLYVVARLPDRLGAWGLGGLAALVLLDGYAYTGLALYLWWLNEPIFYAFAMGVVVSSMLTVTWIRTDSVFLWSMDCISIGTVLLLIPVVHHLNGAPVLETLLLAGLLVLVFIYFGLAIWSIWHARRDSRRVQEVEIQRAKSDAFGKIAGGMAHDFNNLLTVVLGNIELSRLAQHPGERAQLIEEAETAAKRGAEMIRQLLAFSRKARLDTRCVEVTEIVAGVSPLIGSVLGQKHRVNHAPIDNLPSLEVDMGKVQSVLLELILNARDAMPDGGEIFFEAWSSEALGGPTVSMAIEDKGEGISPDALPLVFEPFFSTKANATGLGLPMVKGIVEQSGGRIDLTSVLWQGTRVTMHFPAVPPAAPTA